MKLPKLVTSKKVLRKILRRGPVRDLSSWDRMGPCPDFFWSAAVYFHVEGELYVVFGFSIPSLRAHQLRILSQDEARNEKLTPKKKLKDEGCIEG